MSQAGISNSSSGGGGTVTSITAGTGLTATPSNPITTSGTLALTIPVVVSSGGTGAITLTGVLLGNGTSAVTALTGNSKVIASNAAGTLAARSFSVVTQVFTSTGTYTATTGMLYCQIIILGGGGAGGGAAATGGATTSLGGGGGAGEYAVGVFSAATIGASQAVTIGAAGAANSGVAGGNGGNTSVGALISANGGTGGGTAAAASIASQRGGAGGTGGSGGSYRSPGFGGGSGLSVQPSSFNYGAYGADSQLGSGGIDYLNIGTKQDGDPGIGYGSGGGGAITWTSQTAAIGGAGVPGVVIVNEYIIN